MTAHEAPDGEVHGQGLTLRDRLAIDRTALANERTLLAYARTGLALVIVGGSLIKFFNSIASFVIGWLFVAAGVWIIAVGSSKFLRVRRRLSALHRNAAGTIDSDRGAPPAAPS